jgi:very-short-patch-repair endonuclease
MPTHSEVIFKKFLIDNKITFIFQKGFLNPFHRIVDFYVPNGKIIIEIDGGYHKETVKKDENKDKIWGNIGYKTIRITNEEINSGFFVNRLDVKSLTNKGLPISKQTSV